MKSQGCLESCLWGVETRVRSLKQCSASFSICSWKGQCSKPKGLKSGTSLSSIRKLQKGDKQGTGEQKTWNSKRWLAINEIRKWKNINNMTEAQTWCFGKDQEHVLTFIQTEKARMSCLEWLTPRMIKNTLLLARWKWKQAHGNSTDNYRPRKDMTNWTDFCKDTKYWHWLRKLKKAIKKEQLELVTYLTRWTVTEWIYFIFIPFAVRT